MQPIDGLFQVTSDDPEESSTDDTCSRVGAATITVVAATGAVVVIASVLKLITWAVGAVASFLLAAAPWVAVLLGIAAYSAYMK
jgi:uncharacterized membrane protein